MKQIHYPVVRESQFIKATRNTGYRSTAAAVSELIDNSIQAGATSVQVFVTKDYSNDGTIAVLVLDNGHGMDPGTMRVALQFGGSQRFNNRDGLGRFGMGLPNSSVSQCRRIELYSWQHKQSIHFTHLDIDEIVSGMMTEIPKALKKPLPNWLTTLPQESGTLVIWQKCDRLEYRKVSTIVRKLHAPIGRKFRHFLFDGINIEINGESVIPVDPLYLNETAILSGAEEYCAPIHYNVKLCNEPASPSLIQVRFVRLPVLEWYDWPTAKKRRYGIVGGAGVSVVRAKREIAYGWYFMGKKRRQNYDDWWRCEIQFKPELDEWFGVNHSKQEINPSASLKQILSGDIESIASRLNSLARLDFIKAKAQTKPKSAGTAESREILLSPPTHSEIRLGKELTLDATLPNNPRLGYDIKTQASLQPEFFTWKFDSNVLQVSINENHPFFTRLYQPLKNSDSSQVLHDLECLLLSHARSEVTVEPADPLLDLGDFRVQWSHILAAFLT